MSKKNILYNLQKLFDKKMTIPDLFSLNSEQVTELKSKNFMNGFESFTKELIDLVGLDNLIQLYSNTKDDFQNVYELYKSIVSNGNSWEWRCCIDYGRVLIRWRRLRL